MKKCLLILGLVLGLSSCNNPHGSKSSEFNYKGHHYIKFENGAKWTNNYAMSVVHDPDCPCHKKELKE